MNQNGLYDCLIIGAGPVGLAMTRALHIHGLSVCLAGWLPQSDPNSPDLRTAALFAGSVRLLERLGAWERVKQAHATPMTAIRIIDGTGHLLRAPEQMFSAQDIGAAELGHNVPNPALTAALSETLTGMDEINLEAKVERVTVGEGYVEALLGDGTARRGRVAIAADGRQSITRAAAGIGVTAWDQDQAAITAHFEHALPHDGVSTEIHTRTGPCTVVPLTGNRSSLVWMDQADAARLRAALPDADFARALEVQLAGLLGPIGQITPRRVFPLSSMIADRFGARRVALIGEAAHAFPPIGAQGLNLGLRDAASLADHLGAAQAAGCDIGADDVLAAYSAGRRADIMARTYGVDVFNRSLGNRAGGFLRGALLHAAKASGGIRRQMMARGLEPVGEWPTLMRP